MITVRTKLIFALTEAILLCTLPIFSVAQGNVAAKRTAATANAAPALNGGSAPTIKAPSAIMDASLPGSAFAGVVPGPDGRLYGVTYDGGTSNRGTIYRVDPATLVVTTVHSFNGAGDGSVPYDELTLDADTGNFYGATSSGGPSGVGTIFEFNPVNNAFVTLRSSFSGFSEPRGSLVKFGGFLFGLVARANGAVFRMGPDGSGFTIIHAFTEAGSLPQQLTLGADNMLYGATIYGGIHCAPANPTLGCGTLFRLRPVVPGDGLDLSFDSDGRVRTDFVGSNLDGAFAIAIQPDGKIITTGRAIGSAVQQDFDFALSRYNPDGSLDPTFDGDGKMTTPFPSNSRDEVFGVAIQADGKIITAGRSADNFALARYNSDGSLDTSFDSDGKVTTDFGSIDAGRAIVIQTDGKIVVAGTANNGPDFGNDFALARYNANGSLDNTFDGDGKVTTDYFQRHDTGTSAAIQTDGKIVVAGYARTATNNFDDIALARYNPDGSLDTSFDADGKLTTNTPISFSSDQANAVAIQTDGKIITAGFTDNSAAGSDFLLVRYNPNGSLDANFDGDGIVTTSFVAADLAFAYGVAIQSNGKIVAVGEFEGEFALARYNSNGSLDSSFDSDGKLTTDFNNRFDKAFAVAIQTDGKIVAVGESSDALAEFALARYHPGTTAGDTPVQFQTLFQFQGASVIHNYPTGKLVIGSDGNIYGATLYSLFRFNPQNANPASTFQFIWSSGGGVSVSVIEGSDGRLYAADYGGGPTGAGRIFSINRDGSGITDLHLFSFTTGSKSYGPYGRLYRNPAGTVYGTTEYTIDPPSRGTVFAITAVAAVQTKLKVTGGNILVGTPGQGIILKSPSGAACRMLSIDNAGAIVLTSVTCP